MSELPKISLVIGGASSGKSRWAEKLVVQTGRARSYIATAEALDSEMQARIARHRQDRGDEWATIEAPRDLAAALAVPPAEGIALVDCITMWLSNHMLAKSALADEVNSLLRALETARAPVVLVTNEVGTGGIAGNDLARRFQTEQGRINQRLAARAGLVVSVTAGLPQVLKGSAPEGRV